MMAFGSDEVAALRIGIAFVFLSPLIIKHHKIDFKKYLPGILLMGFFGNFFPAFLFTKAETEISSSLAGMLNALTPMFTIVVGVLWLKVKPTKIQGVGIISGLIAAILLLYFDGNNSQSKNALFGLLVVGATLSYAISVNGIRYYLHDLNPVKATVWAFTFTGPLSLIYLFTFTDFTIHVTENTNAQSSLLYIGILAIIGTALSVIAFNVLIREAGAVFASTCTYLIPIVAIIWGLVDYEAIHPVQVFAILVIILSVYYINRSK